jgi:hypothetical protein
LVRFANGSVDIRSLLQTRMEEGMKEATKLQIKENQDTTDEVLGNLNAHENIIIKRFQDPRGGACSSGRISGGRGGTAAARLRL